MKKLIYIITVLLMVTATYGCNDILEKPKPSESISGGEALSSAGGITSLRASLYATFHGQTYSTKYFLGPSALADGLVSRVSASRYDDYVKNNERTGMGTWSTSYDLINDANLMINSVKKGVIPDATLKQYRGEAYMIRAFAYHQLVRAYAYEPGVTPKIGDGQGWDLGVIIRTQPTNDASNATYRPRKTVEQVYALIISDLKKSISLLSDGDSGDRNYITKAAAEAELARVQLYNRNYTEANSMAQAAIEDAEINGAHLATTKQEVANEFDETKYSINPEGIWVVDVDPSTESEGVNNSLNVYTAEQYLALVPSQDIMDLYSKDDYRLAWFGACLNERDNTYVTGCRATSPYINLPKESSGIDLSKWNAEQGQYADDLPYLRIPEMLLIESEARLKGASGDPAAPLNKLRQARGLSALSSVTMDDILNERRREFIGEGQRYYDLKRLGRTIRKAPASVQRKTAIEPVPFNDFRIIDDIPQDQVSLSEANAPQDSVLIQNPGY